MFGEQERRVGVTIYTLLYIELAKKLVWVFPLNVME